MRKGVGRACWAAGIIWVKVQWGAWTPGLRNRWPRPGHILPLLNLFYPHPPEPLGVVSLQMHIPMRKLRPEKGIDFPFFVTQQGG